MSYYQSRSTVERRQQQQQVREQKTCLECGRALGETARSGKRLRHPECTRKYRSRIDGARQIEKRRAMTHDVIPTVKEAHSELAALVARHHPCSQCGELTMQKGPCLYCKGINRWE